MLAIGQEFGRLRVESGGGRDRSGHRLWLCRCSCSPSTLFPVAERSLLSEKSPARSCGCLQREIVAAIGARRRAAYDEAALFAPLVWSEENSAEFMLRIGAVVGRLTVVGEGAPNRHGQRVWLCDCACGETRSKPIEHHRLMGGRTRSCGCLLRDTTIARNTTHGHANVGKITPEYRVWLSMKDRCLNDGSLNFHDYGKRGIRVCAEWQDSFEAFLRDMGPRPSPKHSLERKEVNGHYEPGNCVWATRRERANNTRRTVLVVYNGVEMPLQDACRLAGISDKTYRARKELLGWPEEDLFLPVDPTRSTRTPKTGRPPTVTVEYEGERLPLRDAAARSGVGYGTLKSRLLAEGEGSHLFRPVDTRKSRYLKSLVSTA